MRTETCRRCHGHNKYEPEGHYAAQLLGPSPRGPFMTNKVVVPERNAENPAGDSELRSGSRLVLRKKVEDAKTPTALIGKDSVSFLTSTWSTHPRTLTHVLSPTDKHPPILTFTLT